MANLDNDAPSSEEQKHTMTPMFQRCVYGTAVVLVLITAVLLLGDLRSDSPGDIDHSAGMVFDPPSKCQTARNQVLYGQWRTDEWTPYLHGLLHTLIQIGVFTVFGSNMVTMRAPGALMFLLALLLMAEMVSRRKGPTAGLITFTLAAVNPVTLAYGRSGLLEPQLIFWVVLSAWALDRAPGARREGSWLFLCGVAASAAFWTKGMAVYYLIAIIVILLVWPPVRRRNTLYFFIPVIIAVALYVGPFMTINKPFFEREVKFWMGRAQHGDQWALWMRQPVFHQLASSRWLLAFGLLAVPLCWRKYRNQSCVPYGLRALSIMIIIGLQATAFMQYRPLRYSALVFVASIPLTAWLIATTLDWARDPCNQETLSKTKRSMPLALLTFALLTYVLAFSVIYPLASHAPASIASMPLIMRFMLSSLLAGGLMLLWYGPGRSVVSHLVLRAPSIRVLMVTLLWAAVFVPLLIQHALDIRIRALTREHQMYHFSKQLGEEYRDMLFAGTSPAFGGVENEHQFRKVTNYDLNHQVMSDPALSHLLIPDAWGTPSYFKRAFPDAWHRAEAIESITISGFTHTLYALDRKPPRVEDEQLLINPDPHNPAYLSLLPQTLGNSASKSAFAGLSIRLLPMARITLNTSGNFRVVEHHAWERLPPLTQHHGVVAVTNPFTRDQRALELSGHSSKGALAKWSVSNTSPVHIIGLRLHAEEDSVVHIEWAPQQGAPQKWTMRLKAADIKQFTPVSLWLSEASRSSEGQLTIALSNGGRVLCDDLMLLLRQCDWKMLPRVSHSRP